MMCTLAGCNSEIPPSQWAIAPFQSANAQRSAGHPQHCCREMVQAKPSSPGRCDASSYSNMQHLRQLSLTPVSIRGRAVEKTANTAPSKEGGPSPLVRQHRQRRRAVPAAASFHRCLTLSARRPRPWPRLGARGNPPRLLRPPAGASLRRRDWRCTGPAPAGSTHPACRK